MIQAAVLKEDNECHIMRNERVVHASPRTEVEASYNAFRVHLEVRNHFITFPKFSEKLIFLSPKILRKTNISQSLSGTEKC